MPAPCFADLIASQAVRDDVMQRTLVKISDVMSTQAARDEAQALRFEAMQRTLLNVADGISVLLRERHHNGTPPHSVAEEIEIKT